MKSEESSSDMSDEAIDDGDANRSVSSDRGYHHESNKESSSDMSDDAFDDGDANRSVSSDREQPRQLGANLLQ